MLAQSLKIDPMHHPFRDCTLSDGQGIYRKKPRYHFFPEVAQEASRALAFAAVREMEQLDSSFEGLLVFVVVG